MTFLLIVQISAPSFRGVLYPRQGRVLFKGARDYGVILRQKFVTRGKQIHKVFFKKSHLSGHHRPIKIYCLPSWNGSS